MSVWFTESFRGQVFWDVSRIGAVTEGDFLSFTKQCPVTFVGGTIVASGEHPEVSFPKGISSSIDTKFLLETFYRYSRDGKKLIDGGGITKALLRRGCTFKTGLAAVYRLYTELDRNAEVYVGSEADTEASFLWSFVEHGFRSQTGLMKTTARVSETAIKRTNRKALREATVYQKLTTKVRSMINLRWKNRVRKQAHGEAKAVAKMENFADLADLGEDWTLHYDGWLTYLHFDSDEADEWYVLTTVDLDRLQQMLISRSMLALHEATWPCTADNSANEYAGYKKRIYKLFSSAIESASNAGEDAGLLCRDMRKVFNTYLSMAAGELSDEATATMLREIKIKRYDRFFNATKFLGILQSMPFDLAQDLGRIFKLLPAPDYDIAESFAARQDQHRNTNEYKPLDGDNPCNMEEFRQYFRKLMIQTLVQKNHHKGVGKHRSRRAPRWWKDYSENGYLPARLSAVDEIDLTGVCTYKERTEDNPDILKDSAVCEEHLDDVMSDEPDSFRRRNMLLRYLFDSTCPTPEKARKLLTRPEHVHRVGFKMEAHKPIARLFFIGNYTDRIVQSEMEENVHRVALHCPGYIIGQSPEFITTKIMQMVAPTLAYDEEVFFLNFDISAWSPGMRPDVQRISHDIWGEVFDRGEFRHAHRINEKSTIVLNKRGYQAAYINDGANLEGYNGKEMTFLHCALMGYSVYRYRRETGHDLSIPLAAYIDDGLAAFKDKVSNGPTRFLKFAEVVEDTYQRLGFLLEKSKCFLSDSFAIFLNEIYMGGQHITYGLRAIMRVGTKAFEKHETLRSRANTYMSGAQGAMKSGLDVISSFVAYLWLIGRMLLIYGVGEFMDARGAVLYAFTPGALGGLGAGSAVAVMTNLVSDGFTEGVACLQEMCRAYPAYKPKVVRLLRQDVIEKTNVATLLSPGSIEATKSAMHENRLSSAVARALLKEPLARRARILVRLYKKVKLEEMADAILVRTTTISPAVLSEIVSATPLALIEALVKKFNSSRTMSNLIGGKAFRRITRENRADGLNSMATFRRL